MKPSGTTVIGEFDPFRVGYCRCDIVAPVDFLCSDERGWITGQHHLVDGGRAIGS
jgi:NAD(P)-dependent dehydrogenase (short-subunit alcohol dehydrogenase family)